ncbi:hypothetical protein B9T19_03735 [Ignatzschineria sp. F8392]|uniref:phage tail tube protein n=1 Tax=Ignatzschineria sp. F8392 TaxID=1980117 RepID=UPI000B998E51|nr:phage tail tube protein [Ignatzschineria sp. F8392]OYQ81783.1 hypothetical protein B9T19_03735 [Ignatzschineria sp. F8392]
MERSNEIWTQGTQMYVSGIDSKGKLVVYEVEGVKDFSPPQPTKNEIELTTLKDKAKRFMSGLIDAGEGSITLNYLEDDKGQQFLYEMYEKNGRVEVIIGLDNGFGIDIKKTEDGYTLPDTRGWFVFNGIVKQFAIEVGQDDVVKASIVVKSSGEPKLKRKKA